MNQSKLFKFTDPIGFKVDFEVDEKKRTVYVAVPEDPEHNQFDRVCSVVEKRFPLSPTINKIEKLGLLYQPEETDATERSD
jgi:hypothetical protein